MRYLVGILAVATILSGCNGPNTSLSTIQMSGATEPLPPNYVQIASKAVNELPIEAGSTLSFSKPRTIVGATMFSPRRWYVCASGIGSPGSKPVATKPVISYVDDWIAPPLSEGRYDVIVVFSSGGRTSLIKSFDAVLCRA